MIKTIIGIDPGIKGAIASINEHGERVEIIPTFSRPAIKTKKGKTIKKAKTWIDEKLLREYFVSMAGKNVNDCIAIIEDVHAMPGNGSVAMFSFGDTFGVIRGILVGIGIPYIRVRPSVWQKSICGIKKDKKHKPSIQYCVSKYPYLNFKRTDKCKKNDDGMTDALCIAEWGCLRPEILKGEIK